MIETKQSDNTYTLDRKYRYLSFLQDIISRMSDNSFKCKEWCFVVLTALLGLYATNISNYLVLFICVIPISLFWILDTYYLNQERGFRDLYNKKAVLNENSDEFNDFSIRPTKISSSSYLKCFVSKTETLLYATLSICCIIAGIVVFILKSKEII